MKRQQHGSSKTDRKTVEKNRRNQMKSLYSELNSLIPNNEPKEVMSVPDQLDEAVKYIKKLEKQLEQMKEKKTCLMGVDKSRSMSSGMMGGRNAKIEVHSTGSSLEVVLVSGIDCQSLFFDIIRALHEEGANVVNASFSIVNKNIFHTIHSEVGESALDNGAARISSRLKKSVHEYSNSL